MRPLILPILLLALAGCESLVGGGLPDEPPPLADLEEPLDLFAEPDDETERESLEPGSFVGVKVESGRATLEDTGGSPGLLVTGVVENSPADAAGVREGDLLLAAVRADGSETELAWPSRWRRLMVDVPPGEEIVLVLDRAGLEREVPVRTEPRVRRPAREAVERFREEDRVGVVLRTATEVEARRAGLGTGGGAVVVGLSATSPWRAAGLRYGDLLAEVAGVPVDHPQVVLNAVREAEEGLPVTVVRGEERRSVELAVSRRAGELRRLFLPPVVDYESERGEATTSILLGLVRHRTTPAAWEWRFLWLFRVSGGDADRLVEVENP